MPHGPPAIEKLCFTAHLLSNRFAAWPSSCKHSSAACVRAPSLQAPHRFQSVHSWEGVGGGRGGRGSGGGPGQEEKVPPPPKKKQGFLNKLSFDMLFTALWHFQKPTICIFNRQTQVFDPLGTQNQEKPMVLAFVHAGLRGCERGKSVHARGCQTDLIHGTHHAPPPSPHI